MLTIQFSNRFETLLDSLLAAMETVPASPFAAHEVIVPSAALRQRVELAAADRFGICSNLRFSFLAQWLWTQIGQVVEVAETSPFGTPVLAWRVLSLLADAPFVAAHPALARYVEGADEVTRYELATRVAALLEQYLTYRPDWLAAWVEGRRVAVAGADDVLAGHEHWQGAIWRRIARDLGAGRRHPSVTFFEKLKALGPDAPAHAGLPAAAHLFCLPATPPLYVDILQKLAQWTDLRLYVLNPCREYWLEVVDPRRLSYLAARGQGAYHEAGNRLLSSWGKQTQAHVDLLLQDESNAVVDDAGFAASGAPTLLGRIHDAILDLVDPAPGSHDLAGDDHSIEVHVCHSLTRELEVLHDRLLALFAGPNPPRPSDVLVVTPDLEAAASLIDAVFGNAPPARSIPYAVTGRPASTVDPCARALLGVLATAASRLHASAVFELLQQPIVARRFGIAGTELDAIREWIRVSGIRWGIDGRHRGELGLPADPRHSFADGLDRLFLGYALPAAASEPVNGRLGAGNAEGSAALALGAFGAFVRELRRLHELVATPKTASGWREILLGALEAFVAPSGDEIDGEHEVIAAIRDLHADIARAGMEHAISAEIVRLALQERLDDPARGGAPTGAVTFAAMSSLRNLPYRVVCVVGLNQGAFPSSARPPEFDLMARDRRRGDRQRRIDERNVFLDLVLAARERLYLSYTGRSVRDNTPIPPSVLVDELLDYAARAIDRPPLSPASLAAARKRLVVEHPLQPFSLACFESGSDPRARSFNAEYCDALKRKLAASAAAARQLPATAVASPPGPTPAQPSQQSSAAQRASSLQQASPPRRETAARRAARAGAEHALQGELELVERADTVDETAADDAPVTRQTRFFAVPLAVAGEEFRDVSLDSLARFFRNPCRYLLRERLGIVLAEGDEELEDDEPFVIDWRMRVALAQRVLPRLLDGEPVDSLADCARAGIEYPTGRLGSLERAQELERLAGFAQALSPAFAEPPLGPFERTLDFAIGDQAWRLVGRFGDLRPGGLVRYRYADTRAADYLNGWIVHLFLNACSPPHAGRHTTWHSRDGGYRLRPMTGAREHLAALLALYREGLTRPLHFFPKSAWAYAVHGRSLAKAAACWRASAFGPFPEERDPAYRLALRGVDDPLDEEFEASATTVFAPLLEHIEDDRL